MTKIYEKNFWYTFLRHYVDACIKESYRKCAVAGKKNIPEDGAVILAPNHCNALMDALVVLRSTKEAKVFGARADVFTPGLIGVMQFLRIVPMVRKRDGIRNVIRNLGIIEEISEVLEHDVPFCVFCEGAHRPKHSILPISKGILRVALAANERFGKEKPVYIVPIGLDYGDFRRYRSTSLLTFGQPFNITEELKALEGENEVHTFLKLKEKLRDRMTGLFTFIEDDDNYDAKWTLTRLAVAGRTRRPEKVLEKNRKAIARLDTFARKNPAKAGKLFQRAVEFEQARLKAKVSYHSLNRKRPGLRILGKLLLALVALPYFLCSSVVSLPMWAIAERVKRGVKDPAFYNTVRFGVKLAMLPVLLLVLGLVFFFTLPWYIALPALLLTIPAYDFSYDYAEFIRVFLSDIRLACNKGLREEAAELTSRLKTII